MLWTCAARGSRSSSCSSPVCWPSAPQSAAATGRPTRLSVLGRRFAPVRAGRRRMQHGPDPLEASQAGGAVEHVRTAHLATKSPRAGASWITELSSSARVSATSCSSQDTTKVTGQSGGKRVKPEATIPLAVGPAGADSRRSRSSPSASSTGIGRWLCFGPAAIGVEDAQPEGQFRFLPGAWVSERVERALAPDELLVTQPGIDGELEAVRVAELRCHGNGRLIGAGQEHADRARPGITPLAAAPGRMPAGGSTEEAAAPECGEEVHANRLFRRSAVRTTLASGSPARSSFPQR